MADVEGVDVDAEEFRAGIRTAMGLGLPVDAQQWPVFVRLVDPEPPASGVDEDGVPWQTGEALAGPQESPVTNVACAIEWPPGTADTSQQWGPLHRGELRITLLDTEYALVEGFAYVRVWPAAGGAPVTYHYQRVLGRFALGPVEVWTLLVATEDVN